MKFALEKETKIQHSLQQNHNAFQCVYVTDSSPVLYAVLYAKHCCKWRDWGGKDLTWPKLHS